MKKKRRILGKYKDLERGLWLCEEYNIVTNKSEYGGVFAFDMNYIIFANKEAARKGLDVRYRRTIIEKEPGEQLKLLE